MANYLHNLGVTAYHRALSIPDAYTRASEAASMGDRIVVFGSFYTVAEALENI